MRLPAGPSVLLAFVTTLTTISAHAADPTVAVWNRFEIALDGTAEPKAPLHDLELTVDFRSPTGKTHTVRGFWDGYTRWKARFMPDEAGAWTYATRVTKGADSALAGRKGGFRVVAYQGKNALYRHGAVRVSADRRHFVHADATPFFWLGDTAWNGVMKADLKSWATYLRDRADKRFNVIQYVTTQWRTASGNADARPAFYPGDRLAIDPAFFQWMDRRVDALNDAGMVAAPVLIWAIGGNTARLNPANILPDDQLILLARYMVARYGAHHTVWILAGDADYRGDKAERWKKIGRAVFGDTPRALATMHPGGKIWVYDEFRQEPWFDFNSYQSGHIATDEWWRWHVDGPPARDWKKEPAHPHINLEPNYEAHVARPTTKVFDAHAVRRAAYWSLLVHPPAGVTYGAHGIWSWELEPQAPMTHPYTGVAPAWHQALKLPGSVAMKHLATLFSTLRWWTLRPSPELVVDQSGRTTGERWIAAARGQDAAGRAVAIIYVPAGGEVTADVSKLGGDVTVEWVDPATGVRRAAGNMKAGGAHRFYAPGAPAPDRDWVLLLRAPRP